MKIHTKHLNRIIIIIGLLFMTSGCSKGGNEDLVHMETEVVSNPAVISTESEFKTNRDGKEVIDGFWRRTLLNSEGETQVSYIPLNLNKTKGIYDLEDYFDDQGKRSIYKTYFNLNKPEGTSLGQASSYNHSFTSNSRYFVIKDDAEVNTDTIYEYNLEVVQPVWNTTIRDNAISIDRADVGCFTFALYEHLSRVPNITLSFYGVSKENFEKYRTFKVGDNPALFLNEKQIYKDYKNKVDCLTLLTSCPITETCIKYVDYKDITKGIEYYDVIGVIEFDEYIDEFSFYINGDFTYNISDMEQYLKWKSDYEELLIK